MNRRLRAVPIAATLSCAFAWAIGCNAISGVNDLDRVAAPEAGGGGGVDVVTPPVDASEPADVRTHDFDAIAPVDGAQTIPDAGVVDANAGLCEGLTLMLRLDGTTTSSQGTVPSSSTGVKYVTGKFGQALNATGTTQVDYPASPGPIVSSSQGTMSMWIDSQWELPCNNPHLFFGVDDNGVYMDCEPPGYLGLYVDLSASSGVSASIDPSSGRSVWTTGWNHLVATWSSSPPSLSITLNGAVGQQTSAPWSPPDPVAAVLHLASSGTSSGADIDDVAVWTRPLTAAEIHTIYLAGTSVADVCKLK